MKKSIHHLYVHILLIMVCGFFLIPILYTLSVSLKSSNTLISSNFKLIPDNPTFDNYKDILFEKPFLLWLKNSLLLTIGTVIATMVVALPAAYAYTRLKFKGKSGSLFLLLLLNAFPAILSMVAIYRLFKTFSLMNNYVGLIIVYTGTMVIFSIWNLKGYFETIPADIEQAAMVDGANNFTIILKIILPLARPTIIVTGMVIFITSWNEYIYAVNFLSDVNKYTLAAGLYSIQGTNYTRNWPVFAAGSMLTSLPTLLIFFGIQRYLVSGLTVGGVKY
ncbi:sugar ABC transporter permease [Anaerocolumna sp. MB42-C2]|uniref:sugar ABC transporter permease n=1 Tax=Anaerocolumna sp. MB42-C2 TaxID=3070997 RepID=UPI0027DEE86A|nr:carbohydrate ABC transporter permease [Anaerocolumna sp. MB42-C2]WMJ87175.1 carbohydrate ABC transporter permease [Anaerocolumna sp. MB42-C2]